MAGASEAEREGHVLRLVTQTALKACDYSAAHDNCERLMELGCGPAWRECRDLAQVEEFKDIRAKYVSNLLCLYHMAALYLRLTYTLKRC